MANPLPNLIWLRSFESAARLLNFTEAAAELGLTQAAVSVHIKSLEAWLGSALFHRQPRNLTLTEMGRAYYPAVQKAIEDLTLSTSGLFGPTLRQVVNLRAPISTAVLWILPQLADLNRQHPEIELRIVSSIWADRLSDTDADIDLQLGLPDRFPQATEFLCEETITPVCHPDRAGSYDRPEKLLAAPLIHILGFEDHWTRYFDAYGLDPTRARYRFSVDTTVAAMEMVAAGVGVAPVLTRFADQGLRSGRRLAKLTGPVALEQAHFLVAEGHQAPPRPEVSVVRDWLRDLFKQV